MKVASSILLLSLFSVALGGNTFRPRVNLERIKREDLPIPEHENVHEEEKISDEGWVLRPSEDSQPTSDDIPIETPEKPSEQPSKGNVTSLENLQLGSVVVDTTKVLAGAITTIVGGVLQATAGIVDTVYRPPIAVGNFTFPREACKLRISDEATKLYKDTQMDCVAMSRLIKDVEVQAQKVVDQSQKVDAQPEKVVQSEKADLPSQKTDDQSQKVDDKSSIKLASPDLKCVFIRTKPDTTELEKRIDCELLQTYTQKYAP